MKKVMLVGVGGYIGGKFTEYIHKNYPDWQVDAVDSMNRKWAEADFTGYDAVYNVSGLAHANARQGTEEQYYAVNGQLPIDVAMKAKAEGVPMFVQMSSMVVYGDMSGLGEEKNILEDTVPAEPTIYGKSKMMAERGLQKLVDETFQVAIMRPPLIYSEYARDNFPRLVNFAKKMPIFPKLKNQQSMVYVDNLCELVHLIIENNKGGIYYPQQECYIETSKIVKDIADAVGNKMWQTKFFNPFLKLFSKWDKLAFIHKAFGSITYDMSISNHFGGKYRVVSYEESIRRIAKAHMTV
ncbi:MAG: NAD-dependent epimerase/dehydratase family protein [Bacteroides sp.]|nr:NAD-dependent epimerase/dehydratase family protein [Bacteroides sp.]